MSPPAYTPPLCTPRAPYPRTPDYKCGDARVDVAKAVGKVGKVTNVAKVAKAAEDLQEVLNRRGIASRGSRPTVGRQGRLQADLDRDACDVKLRWRRARLRRGSSCGVTRQVRAAQMAVAVREAAVARAAAAAAARAVAVTAPLPLLLRSTWLPLSPPPTLLLLLLLLLPLLRTAATTGHTSAADAHAGCVALQERARQPHRARGRPHDGPGTRAPNGTRRRSVLLQHWAPIAGGASPFAGAWWRRRYAESAASRRPRTRS